MLAHASDVVQTVDRDTTVRLRKEIRHTEGPVSVALVRKYALDETAHTGAGPRPTVLLVHGFVQNRYAWHLTGRSFVNHLARAGFDVFNLDLRGHGRSRTLAPHAPCSLDLAIDEDLPAAFAEVRACTGADQVFVMGHSAGALVSCAFAPRIREHLAGLVALAVPYRFGAGNLLLAGLARVSHAVAGGRDLTAMRSRVPGRAVGRTLLRTLGAWEDTRVPMPVRAWQPQSIEPELLREYLQKSFDSASFDTLVQLLRVHIRGGFHSADGTIDYAAAFESVDRPLLVVSAHDDLLAPPASVRPAFERSQSHDKRYHELPGGHGDLLLGRDAPSQLWPLVTEWLLAHAAR